MASPGRRSPAWSRSSSRPRSRRFTRSRARLGVPARFFAGRASSRPRRRGSPTPRPRCSRRPAATASPRARRSPRPGRRARCWSPRPSRRARPARSPAPRRRSIPSASAGPRAGSRSSAWGPGAAAWRTPEATALLDEAEDWVGYRRLSRAARAPGRGSGAVRHAFALGEEEARARRALDLAAAGRRVALVSSGDAGIYAHGGAGLRAAGARRRCRAGSGSPSS